MRYILIALATFFMASCSTDLEITPEVESFVEVDFAGIYLGTIDCNGSLEDSNGENWFMTVTKIPNANLYTVNMGDDVVFEASTIDNELIIEEQTLNEEYDFDVVTLSGRIFQNEDETFTFEFEHEVDDEGKSDCSVTLVKQ